MMRFDVVILGAGPAGERAAIQAAKLGKRAALVEQARVVGGTGVVWGAIPSKTLRESALEDAYAAAYGEWNADPDAPLWDGVTADGVA